MAKACPMAPPSHKGLKQAASRNGRKVTGIKARIEREASVGGTISARRIRREGVGALRFSASEAGADGGTGVRSESGDT